MTNFDQLLPRPVAATQTEGTFTIDRRSCATMWQLPTDGQIQFHIDPQAVPQPEGYRLEITQTGIRTTAADRAGAHYAAQTLRQLLGPDAYRTNFAGGPIPCGVIMDHPRFQWRGCLLDVARHFMPKAGVLRFIDLLAAHKLNILHLHLTDDQGWRIEIPAFPRLTETGAWRTESRVGTPPDGKLDGQPHGGYYTTEDLQEIVAYAAERAITVVPEVDIPGHTQAAIAAYPALGNTGAPLPVWTSWGVDENILNVAETTVDFFRAVFDHVVEIFPSRIIAVGGDEVPTTQWEQSPAAQQRMKELGLTETKELHGWFVREIVHHLATRDRRALGWDEIAGVGPVPPGTIIASWRGEQAGIAAAKAGYDVVMCPEQYVYLDHRQSTDLDEPVPVGIPHTLADVYGYQPIPPSLTGPAADHVLGAQAQIWTEHLDSPRRVDYAAFPRLAAFAEVVWTQPELRDQDDFRRRIEEEHLPRLDAMGVEYRPLTGPHPWQRRPGIPGRPR